MNVTPQSSQLRPDDFLDASAEAHFPSLDKCTQAAITWLRNGALFDLLRDCVQRGDVVTLNRLHEDSLPIHEILGYAPAEPFDSSALPLPFRAGEGQLVAALRAWSGVAIAAVTTDGVQRNAQSIVAWLEISLAWPLFVSAAQRTVDDDLLAALMHEMRECPAGMRTAVAYVFTRLREPTVATGRTRAVTTRGAIENAQTGREVSLTVTTSHVSGAVLLPDPATMLFFRGDRSFQSALATSWKLTRGRKLGSVVTFELTSGGQAVTQLSDASLGLAMTVALRELRSTASAWRRFMNIRRIRKEVVFIGAVTGSGKLVSVGGYDRKLQALPPGTGVIIPDQDEAAVEPTHSPVEIHPVPTWRRAAFRAKSLNRQATIRLMSVVAALLLATSLLAAVYIQSEDRQHLLESTATRLAESARELTTQAGADELGLLLAMASDDLAEEAGGTTSVFDDLARDHDTLIKVVRPAQGRPRLAAMSRDGAVVIVGSDVGSVQIMDGADGRTTWSRDYPPGQGLAPDQVRIKAVAMSEAGDRAAYTATDLTVHVLSKAGDTWEEDQVALPVPDTRVSLRDPVYALDMLVPAGLHAFVGYGSDSGLFWFDALLDSPPVQCAAPPDAVAVNGDEDYALVVLPTRVVSVSKSSCREHTVFTAPDGTALADARPAADGTLTVVATRGADLLTTAMPESLNFEVGDPFENAEQTDKILSGEATQEPSDASELRVIASAGPYQEVRLTDNTGRAQVGLRDSRSTMVVDLGSGSVVQRFENLGLVVDNGQNLLWLHDGGVEIRDVTRTAAVLQSYPLGDVTSAQWAGNSLVLRQIVGLSVIPDAVSPGGPQRQVPLRTASGANSLGLATDLGGARAAALVIVAEPNVFGPAVWDTVTGQLTNFPIEGSRSAGALRFIGGDLYVGYRDGSVARFHEEPARGWREVGRAQVGDTVSALGGDLTDGAVYVLTGAFSSAARAVKVDAATMAVVGGSDLDGAGGFDGLRVSRLTTGEIAMAYGDGIVEFLDSDSLASVGRFHRPSLERINNLTEVPNRKQLIVSGRAESVVLDETTHAPVAASVWQRTGPLISASVNASGSQLATVSYVTGSVAVWDLTSDLRDQVCSAIGRDLTADEWNRFAGDEVEFHSVCT